MGNRLREFMIGRNGGDQLSLTLIILSLILIIISSIVKMPIINYLSYIPLGLSIFRMFSKDVEKRRMENYKFMMKVSPLYSWYHRKIQWFKNRKKYKYFKCPNCNQKLRAPKGKGKIKVNCSKCNESFTKTT